MMAGKSLALKHARVPSCLIATALCLTLLGGGIVQAQDTGGGLIQLPGDDGLATAAEQNGLSPALDDERFDPARRGLDGVAQAGAQGWVSPLRLTDLQVPVDGTAARISGERQVVGFDLYVNSPTARQ